MRPDNFLEFTDGDVVSNSELDYDDIKEAAEKVNQNSSDYCLTSLANPNKEDEDK